MSSGCIGTLPIAWSRFSAEDIPSQTKMCYGDQFSPTQKPQGRSIMIGPAAFVLAKKRCWYLSLEVVSK